MAIQEIGFKGEVVSGVALRTLDQIKDARRAYRKAHRDDPHDHSIRFITSNYDELFRITDGGKVKMDYPDRSFVAPCAARFITFVSLLRFWSEATEKPTPNRKC